jgi:hypothetical protein
MNFKVYFRYFALPLALTALLIVTTTFGAAWHSHDSNSDQNCPICHFNHQPLEKPLAGIRLPVLAPVGTSATIAQPTNPVEPSIHRVPARAPPSA